MRKNGLVVGASFEIDVEAMGQTLPSGIMQRSVSRSLVVGVSTRLKRFLVQRILGSRVHELRLRCVQGIPTFRAS